MRPTTVRGSRSRPVLFSLVFAVLLAGLALTGARPARAGTAPVLYGSNWLSGHGVNACPPSARPRCGGQEHVGGVRSNWWQCVELAQRLYYDRGWYTANRGVFSGVGYAYQIWDKASSLGMSAQAQGSISSIAPGDMIVYYYSPSDPRGRGPRNPGNAGHVAIVSSISGSTVTAVEQNFDGAADEAAYTFSSGTLTRTAPYGGTVRDSYGYALPLKGIVHSPDNPFGSYSSGADFSSTYIGSQLTTDSVIYGNGYLMPADRRFVLILRSDGNLVEYGPPGYPALLACGSTCQDGTELALDGNGNLVLV